MSRNTSETLERGVEKTTLPSPNQNKTKTWNQTELDMSKRLRKEGKTTGEIAHHARTYTSVEQWKPSRMRLPHSPEATGAGQQGGMRSKRKLNFRSPTSAISLCR